MKEKLNAFFAGRQGMDELSKMLFWVGLLAVSVSIITAGLLAGIPAMLIRFFGFMALITAFIRAFSRRLEQREAENRMYLAARGRKKQQWADYKERRRQSGEYRFFKCPGCGKWLRVPRGKGKIHINCRCGYTLYRKT